MCRLKSLYTVALFVGGVVMQIPEIRAIDNSYTLGGNPPYELEIRIQSGGMYWVYRHDAGSYKRQFYASTIMFVVKIGSIEYRSAGLTINDVSATTTGVQQEVTKLFSGTFTGKPFSVRYTINYNISNPDYFTLSATIDASSIPSGTSISLAYGFDAYVNDCDGGAAITIPDLGYNDRPNPSAQDSYLTQAQVQSLRLVGGMNTRGNGSLIGFFTLGRPFDRAVSAYYGLVSTNGSNMINNTTNTFLFGPYNVPSCSGGGAWDNGVGVIYDNIPSGVVTTVRTGLTFTTDMDGELDYTWNGQKNLVASIGDNVNLDLIYRSYNSQIINGIGFDVDLQGLDIYAPCTQSGFLSGVYSCVLSQSRYGVSGASIAPYDSAMMEVPVSITQCGQWIIDADAISNMARTLPLGTPATLTVPSSIHLLPVTTGLCQGDSLSFTIAFPPGVSSAFDFNVHLSYTGDLTSFSAMPQTVLFPADSNSITIAVQTLPNVHSNSVLNVTLTGTDKVFVTIDSLADSTVTLLFGVPNILTTNDVIACSNTTATIRVGSQDATATLTWYSDAACTNQVASGASFTIPAVSDTILYVKSVSNNSCDNYDSVRVTVHETPVLTIEDVADCNGSTVTIAASTTNSTDVVRWYNDPQYTNLIAQAHSFGVTATSSATYYVRAVSENNCIAQGSAVLTVYPQPVLTTSDTTVCAGSIISVSASSNNDRDTLFWYSDPLYSSLITQGTAFTTPVLTSDVTFYVEASGNPGGCKTRDNMKVSVIARPSVIAMDNQRICYGDEMTLFLKQSDGDITWNTPQLTGHLTSSQTYIVTASRWPCPDARDTVTITVGDSLYIRPDVLPPYKRNLQYSEQLTTNAISPVYSLIDGELPAGLQFRPDGTIDGLPFQIEYNDAGYPFRVQVTDQ
ncbi:MAG: hypothetical protein LBF90_03855, partial [Prevotellaceae bacterium]|nr:hypothetical protein [Prevotellaceae bacterium]